MSKKVDVSEVTKPLEQPYVERQLIVVLDDAIVEATREEQLKELQHKNFIDWNRVSAFALGGAIVGIGDLITEVALDAYKAWSRARGSGLPIVQILKTEARNITFPPGHPRDGILYIGHPAIPNVYYTTADFHRVIFEHKFSEAVKLLLNLGATEINVEHHSGWERAFSSNLSVPLPSSDVSVRAETSMNNKSEEKLLFTAQLEGTDTPKLPNSLVWYPHEPTWQTIAEARLEFGLKDFVLNVTYNDDFGVNAGLKVAVSKTGLDLGGKFEDHTSTEWRISGKFRNKLA